MRDLDALMERLKVLKALLAKLDTEPGLLGVSPVNGESETPSEVAKRSLLTAIAEVGQEIDDELADKN